MGPYRKGLPVQSAGRQVRELEGARLAPLGSIVRSRLVAQKCAMRRAENLEDIRIYRNVVEDAPNP
jgi:hypothetical protein